MSSNQWMKTNPNFQDFEKWGEGYYAVSIGIDGLEECKKYIID